MIPLILNNPKRNHEEKTRVKNVRTTTMRTFSFIFCDNMYQAINKQQPINFDLRQFEILIANMSLEFRHV